MIDLQGYAALMCAMFVVLCALVFTDSTMTARQKWTVIAVCFFPTLAVVMAANSSI